ncbi:MAG TPA: hypothetical protein VLN49_15825 [Gemmatimonadaceae bacterium]|nr:hypothetical protein [Gemmatimonadaceae bacterium]
MRKLLAILTGALVAMPAAASIGQTPEQTSAKPRPGPVARVVRASLRGIQLTDAEKSGIATVRKTYAPQFKAIADSAKPIRVALRTARQQHDTAAARAAMRELRASRRSGVAVLRQTLVAIRASLAQEHQTQFDANLVRVRRLLRRIS